MRSCSRGVLSKEYGVTYLFENKRLDDVNQSEHTEEDGHYHGWDERRDRIVIRVAGDDGHFAIFAGNSSGTGRVSGACRTCRSQMSRWGCH